MVANGDTGFVASNTYVALKDVLDTGAAGDGHGRAHGHARGRRVAARRLAVRPVDRARPRPRARVRLERGRRHAHVRDPRGHERPARRPRPAARPRAEQRQRPLLRGPCRRRGVARRTPDHARAARRRGGHGRRRRRRGRRARVSPGLEGLHKVTLAAPVAYAGFPQTPDDTATVVFGNVVDADQGKTEPEAAIGSGDGRSAFQTFKLPKAPLTYHQAPSQTPPQAPGLEVTVAGRTWTRVESLFGQGPDAEVYIVREDGDGSSWVQFGDGGEFGARLPSGVDNVRATRAHRRRRARAAEGGHEGPSGPARPPAGGTAAGRHRRRRGARDAGRRARRRARPRAEPRPARRPQRLRGGGARAPRRRARVRRPGASPTACRP